MTSSTESPEPGRSGTAVALLVVVVVFVVVSVAAAWLGNFRLGAYTLASGLAALAVARAVLPVRLVGPLAVRSRALDVVTAAALAVALVVLAEGVPL